MTNESPIPRRSPSAALERMLYEEAGYRCAIPTCKSTSVLEMAHIKPWAEVLANEFENMILLCALCHGLFDREKKIPERSIRNYKANLGILNGRYNDFERRMFDEWQAQGLDTPIRLEVSASTRLNTRNLIGDSLAVALPAAGTSSTMLRPGGGIDFVLPVSFNNPNLPMVDPSRGERIGGTDEYSLTAKGREFVQRLFGAAHIDG